MIFDPLLEFLLLAVGIVTVAGNELRLQLFRDVRIVLHAIVIRLRQRFDALQAYVGDFLHNGFACLQLGSASRIGLVDLGLRRRLGLRCIVGAHLVEVGIILDVYGILRRCRALRYRGLGLARICARCHRLGNGLPALRVNLVQLFLRALCEALVSVKLRRQGLLADVVNVAERADVLLVCGRRCLNRGLCLGLGLRTLTSCLGCCFLIRCYVPVALRLCFFDLDHVELGLFAEVRFFFRSGDACV